TCLSLGLTYESYVLLEKFNIPKDFVSSTEFQQAAKNCLIDVLSRTYIDDYKKQTRYIAPYVHEEVITGAVNKAITKYLLENNIHNALRVKQQFDISVEFLSSPEIQQAAKGCMTHCLSLGIISAVVRIKEEFDISENIFLESVKASTINCLLRENIISVLKIKTEFDLSDQYIIDIVKEKKSDFSDLANIELSLHFDILDSPHSKFTKQLRGIIEFNPNIENQDNNQWYSDVLPLLNMIDKSGISIMENQKEILSYIREIGAIKSLELFQYAYAILKKSLTPEQTQKLQKLGMKAMSLGEFKKIIDNIQDAILNNKAEEQNIDLGDSLVYGMFKSRFLLSSTWDRHIDQKKWKEYAETNEYNIPPYLMEIRHINLQVENVRKIESEELSQYIKSKQFIETVIKKQQLFKESLSVSREVLIFNTIKKLKADIENSQRVLSLNNQVMWQEYIDEATDLKERDKRISLQKKLNNPNAKIGILNQIQKIQNIINILSNLPQDNIEALKILSDISEVDELFAKILSVDIFNSSELHGFKDELISDDSDKIQYTRTLHDFLNHGLRDHYIDKINDPKLIDKIHKVLGLIKSQKDKNSIDLVKEKIESLSLSEVVDTEKIDLELIPVSGIARLTAGNIGDACYTSQINNMHENVEYHRVHAFLFGRRDQKSNLNFKGSCLLIETEDVNGETVFVIRANNPREGFLMSMSERAQQSLVDQIIDAFKEYLKKYQDETGKKAKLAIIDDLSTQSSTNRNQVWKAYRKYTGNKQIKLIDLAETNFNGYKLSEKTILEV
ncbi:MAG TPA: hypothetical protein PKA96_03105, partial [Candidatus Paceibacterota bacterium]|nr:hypothetical protein [Candidatus Paceibacterota bacterium]